MNLSESMMVRILARGTLIAILFAGMPAGAQTGKEASEAGVLELEEAARQYLEAAETYRGDVQSVFEREISRRKRFVDWRYKRDSEGLEAVLRERRTDAIRAFERFLERHPDHPKYSPEVMFRLAELYYEQSQDFYYLAVPHWETQHELWERGKIPEEPIEPVKDYSRSIDLYRALITSYPEYALLDAARYALAICYDESMDTEKSLEALHELIETHPDSRWIPEAWLRVGEYYFDVGQFNRSIEAYEHALVDKTSRYFEMALYKLAWSYFQKYDYPTAIGMFKSLISHIDEAKGTGGLGAQLRSEAVEYLGVSLADDDWNGDGETDPDATVARAMSYLAGGLPYEREILEKYADTLYASHEVKKYPMAIEAYRAVIALDPLDHGNAALKEKIIGVFDTMRDIEKMTAERQDMVVQFGPGSAWYEANKSRPEVIARVDRQVELALSQAAKFHHKRAQELKAMAANTGDQKFGVAALQEYKLAADVYRDYLKRFPSTKEAYELAYYYAECLYFSFEFERAIDIYQRVRDWPNKKKYLESSAYNVIDSLEKQAAKMAAEGLIRPEDVPGEIGEVEEESTPEVEGKVTIDPLPIPPLTVDWINAVDGYLEKGLQRRKDPELPARLAYRVANEYYRYRHLEEARKRFEAILQSYPDDLVASYAAVNIINSFKLENDWDNIQVWAQKVVDLQVGKPEQRAALQEEVRVFQLGAQFKEAERLYAAEEYLKAADAFMTVVDKDPKMSFADKALQNSAVAFQKEKHFDSAAQVYQRIVSDYPESQYVEGALLQLAENARKFYDFGRAINTYQALRTRFPKTEHNAYALHTTAVLLEAEGRLGEAARAYEEFSKSFPSDPEAGPVLFKAGKLNEKLGETGEAIRLYQLFVTEYGSEPKMSEKVVESISRAAAIYHAQGNTREWDRAAQAVIREYENRGLLPDTPVAEFPARIQFQLLEPKFKKYEAIAFTGSLRTQGKKLQNKEALLRELEVDYSLVMPYKAMEWTTAAYFRTARIYELFADSLFEAEIPEMSEEEMDIYQTQIEDAASGYLDMAQQRYAKIVEQARVLKIANQWTRKAREAMNKYRPQEFPLFKEGRRELEYEVKRVPQFEESL